jgi:O-antigen ligase
LRILELALSAASIVLLARYRSYLATALVGIGISTIAVGAGLSPYGDRLGMAEIGEESLGNPISLGLPAALILILAVAYKGHWLLTETRPVARMALSMGVAATLLLSTSRGSWLVCIIGLLVLFAGSRRRGSIVLGLAPIAIGGMLALASGRGTFVLDYLDKAISPDRSMAQRTTGRYRQWEAMPQILERSPLVGFGPGSGLETNQRFTGSRKAWHSLYLQVAVETGVIGIVLLVLLLGSLWWKAVRHWKTTHDVIPLVATFCFMTIAVSVSGMDAISGVFLGIAFLGRDLRNLYRVREVVFQRPAPATA